MSSSCHYDPHYRGIVASSSITDPQHVGRQADILANPYEREVKNYDSLRPPYSSEAMEMCAQLVAQACCGAQDDKVPARLLDVGTGTGLFLRNILPAIPSTVSSSLHIDAIDPSASMKQAFWLPDCDATFHQSPAENIPLPSSSVSIATCAQAWHWCDRDASCGELARVLRPGVPFILIYNQLMVEFAWVKRLSRIMRSGDVYHPDRPVRLTQDFTTPTLHIFTHGHALSAGDIIELGKTRSSYLRSSPAGKRHMTANLSWYLYDYMGFEETEQVELPYYTLVWVAYKKE